MAFTPEAADDIFQPGGGVRADIWHDTALASLKMALQYAERTNWDSVRSPHLFMGLLAAPDPGVQNWGDRLGADLPCLLDQFRELFHQEDGSPGEVYCLNREFFSDNVIRLLREAYCRALEQGSHIVRPMDILIALFTTPHSIVAECFERVGVTAAKLTELAVMAEQHAHRAG